MGGRSTEMFPFPAPCQSIAACMHRASMHVPPKRISRLPPRMPAQPDKVGCATQVLVKSTKYLLPYPTTKHAACWMACSERNTNTHPLTLPPPPLTISHRTYTRTQPPAYSPKFLPTLILNSLPTLIVLALIPHQPPSSHVRHQASTPIPFLPLLTLDHGWPSSWQTTNVFELRAQSIYLAPRLLLTPVRLQVAELCFR